MNRIVHHALKVEYLENMTKFYHKAFGFREADTRVVPAGLGF